MTNCPECRSTHNYFSKDYGYDLLWEEQRKKYFQELRDELEKDITPSKRRQYQWLLDNNMILIDNSYNYKETY